MQENHKVTTGISNLCEIVKSQCSCDDCDSFRCFAKRRMVPARPCECEDCTDSKSCLFYNANINLSDSKSRSLNIKDINIEITGKKEIELLKKEIPTLDTNDHVLKKQSKVSHGINSLKDNSRNRLSTKEHSASAANSFNELSPSIARLSAKIMDVSYKDFQKSLSKPRFPPSLNNILSPYDILSRIKEAYKACSCKVCECLVGKSLQSDICRCKPCQCRDCVSFSRQVKSFNDRKNLVPVNNGGCPCIRCDRGSCKAIGQGKNKEDCDCVGSDSAIFNRQVKSFNNRENLVPVDDGGCPCVRCNRGSCKGIRQGKNKEDCDCIGLLKSNISTRDCDCEPCHCIECEPKSIHRHRAMIVAPVSEDISHRNECQCSPCECFECGRGFRLSTHLQNEMSTSMNRHPLCQCELCVNEACIPDNNNFCGCARHNRVMSKPFQKDSHDYDIRRATVTYDEVQRRKEANYDTIAMFAAISNTYPEPETGSRRCDCDQCECLDCTYKEHEKKSSKVFFEPIQKYRKELLYSSKLSPSQSTFYTKQGAPANNKAGNVCECEECTCLACAGLANCNATSDRYEAKKQNKGDCSCNPCECFKCEKFMSSCVGDICLCSSCSCEDCEKENFSKEVIYPVKKGEKLTPAIFRSKLKDAFIESCISTLAENDEILKQTSIEASLKNASAFSSYQKTKTRGDYCIGASNQRFSQDGNMNNTANSHWLSGRTETVKHTHISSNNGINLRGRNVEPPLESNLSTYSSMSYLNESGSITPARYKFKSWESSCNSSGHDHPNYLIHFPKTTVKTCLNDVMQFDAAYKNNIHRNIPTTTLSSKNNIIKLNTNLNVSARQPLRGAQPTRKVFSFETPTSNQPEEDIFKYSSQNFEDPFYKPETSKMLSDVVSMLPEKHSLTIKTNNLNCFEINADHKRVQNTLKEAREFSIQLVQLLEKYEKANREFESVAEKIKKSNHFILNEANLLKHTDTRDCTNAINIDQVPTKEKISTKSSAEEVAMTKTFTKTSDCVFLKVPITTYDDQASESLHNIVSYSGVHDTNEGRNESGDDVNKTTESLKTITEEREPIDISQKQDKKRKTLAKLNKKYNKMYKRSIISSKRMKTLNIRSNDTAAVEANNTPILEINRIIEERRSNILEAKTNTIDKDITGDYKANLPESPENINLHKPVNKSTIEQNFLDTEKLTKDKNVFQNDVVMIKEPMFESSRQIVEMKEDKQWLISKNILCQESNVNVRKIFLPTPLEKNIKAAAQIISEQPNDENATYLYKNRALINLHSEVKKLLDLPILSNIERSSHKDFKDILYNNLSKTSSSQTNQGAADENIPQSLNFATVAAKNSCDAMKVNFLNVRRVSDHTVLVKWSSPRALNNVQGYELLVDGRAVQKLLSPSRRMAVVTCLPHSDKVLLTVRTVVSTPRPDHSPATTVIYRPKNK